jgi:hypothetical protein
VWNAPKELVAAPHEVTPHVVQPRPPSGMVPFCSGASQIFGQDWCAHLNVIQQWRFGGFAA